MSIARPPLSLEEMAEGGSRAGHLAAELSFGAQGGEPMLGCPMVAVSILLNPRTVLRSPAKRPVRHIKEASDANEAAKGDATVTEEGSCSELRREKCS